MGFNRINKFHSLKKKSQYELLQGPIPPTLNFHVSQPHGPTLKYNHLRSIKMLEEHNVTGQGTFLTELKI
jgi:hypothetical protein